jgi:hypothetical protein
VSHQYLCFLPRKASPNQSLYLYSVVWIRGLCHCMRLHASPRVRRSTCNVAAPGVIPGLILAFGNDKAVGCNVAASLLLSPAFFRPSEGELTFGRKAQVAPAAPTSDAFCTFPAKQVYFCTSTASKPPNATRGDCCVWSGAVRTID